MLQQAMEPWPTGAVHDTVGAILRDAGYHRSFWSSVAGRALMEVMRFLAWVFDAVRSIPGGKFAVLTVVAVILLIILGRLFVAARVGDELLTRRKAGGARQIRGDPWMEAERLAALGDYMGAAHALYQAVLRRLAATEGIRLHPSKTSGDYTRDLRRRGSNLTKSFQLFGRRFDRVVFGKGVCSAEDFAALRADALAIPDKQAAA
jgi:hypothetical protein